MFNRKKVTLLDEKWNEIKSLKLKTIPRISELIFIDNQYYIVVNLIHSIVNKYELFIVIEKYADFKN
jgi:hypothetical protein